MIFIHSFFEPFSLHLEFLFEFFWKKKQSCTFLISFNRNFTLSQTRRFSCCSANHRSIPCTISCRFFLRNYKSPFLIFCHYLRWIQFSFIDFLTRSEWERRRVGNTRRINLEFIGFHLSLLRSTNTWNTMTIRLKSIQTTFLFRHSFNWTSNTIEIGLSQWVSIEIKCSWLI